MWHIQRQWEATDRLFTKIKPLNTGYTTRFDSAVVQLKPMQSGIVQTMPLWDSLRHWEEFIKKKMAGWEKLDRQFKTVQKRALSIYTTDKTGYTTKLDSAVAQLEAMQSGILQQVKPFCDLAGHLGEFLRSETLKWQKLHKQFAKIQKRIHWREDASQKAYERGDINGAFFDAVWAETRAEAVSVETYIDGDIDEEIREGISEGIRLDAERKKQEREEAFSSLIELLWPGICNKLNSFERRDRDQEDDLQEAYIKLLDIVRSCREAPYINLVKVVIEWPPEKLRNYLLKAVENKLKDIGRNSQSKKHSILTEGIRFESKDEKGITVWDAVMIEENPILDRILDEEMLAIFAERYPRHFRAAILVKYAGYTQRETAELMSISQQRVSALLSEAPEKADGIF